MGILRQQITQSSHFLEALQQELLQHSVIQSGAAISETEQTMLYVSMLIAARQYSLTNVDFPDCVGQGLVI